MTLSPSGTALPVSSGSNNNLGWTAGVGVEWAFWGTWSARAEYDYIRLNNQTYTVTSPTTGATLDTIAANNRTINMVTAGVNYKFGPW